jgi:hypothetical protein
MHTDEYEISLGREITLCRNRVRKLKKSLEKLEKQSGLTTAAFLQALEGGSLAGQPTLKSWHRDYRELQYWQKMLSDYEAARESLKWL